VSRQDCINQADVCRKIVANFLQATAASNTSQRNSIHKKKCTQGTFWFMKRKQKLPNLHFLID